MPHGPLLYIPRCPDVNADTTHNLSHTTTRTRQSREGISFSTPPDSTLSVSTVIEPADHLEKAISEDFRKSITVNKIIALAKTFTNIGRSEMTRKLPHSFPFVEWNYYPLFPLPWYLDLESVSDLSKEYNKFPQHHVPPLSAF